MAIFNSYVCLPEGISPINHRVHQVQPFCNDQGAPRGPRTFGQLGAEACEAIRVSEVQNDLLQLILDDGSADSDGAADRGWTSAAQSDYSRPIYRLVGGFNHLETY